MSNRIMFLCFIPFALFCRIGSILYLPKYKTRNSETLIFPTNYFIKLMSREDGSCASCINLWEPRQYLLVHHFR